MSIAAAEKAWLESSSVEVSPTPETAHQFFGVPPDPASDLERNIGRKRRHWKSKVRERRPSAAAQGKVEEALRIIDALGLYATRGLVPEIDLSEKPDGLRAPETVVNDVDELWRILEELLVDGRLPGAIRTAADARTRFAGAPAASAAFAWVVSVASREDAELAMPLRGEAVAAANEAIAAGEQSPECWTALAILQLDTADPEAALSTLTQAETRVEGGPTPWIRSHKAEALADLTRVEEAQRAAVEAVRSSEEDLALRFNTAMALMRMVTRTMLPIESDQMLTQYRDTVEVAAWCAIGAPDAEDLIRPFRLWGVEAGSKLYTGNLIRRSGWAVWTGFLVLPLLNRWKSKPQWKVFLEGPGSVDEGLFQISALGAIPMAVHHGLMDRLPWASQITSQNGIES